MLFKHLPKHPSLCMNFTVYKVLSNPWLIRFWKESWRDSGGNRSWEKRGDFSKVNASRVACPSHGRDGQSLRKVSTRLGWKSGLVIPSPFCLYPPARMIGSFPTPPTSVSRLPSPQGSVFFSWAAKHTWNVMLLGGSKYRGERKVEIIRRMGRKTRDNFALIWVGKLFKPLIICTLRKGVGKWEFSNTLVGLEIRTAFLEVNLSHYFRWLSNSTSRNLPGGKVLAVMLKRYTHP